MKNEDHHDDHSHGNRVKLTPPAHYLDLIVYGVAAVDGALFVRRGTRLYCVASPARR